LKKISKDGEREKKREEWRMWLFKAIKPSCDTSHSFFRFIFFFFYKNFLILHVNLFQNITTTLFIS
jgi:hypothetical protein